MKIKLENAVVYQGSNLDVLPTLPDNSVDSIVTDPPYELGFMGKSWDNSGIAYSVELWTECMRVLKPGGHLLAFGGSRTWHRLAVAIEDAGFEVRDSIAWLYGSGFPKSMDISKQIDKQAGIDRKSDYQPNNENAVFGNNFGGGTTTVSEPPVTDEAKQWQGWGTALKPAFEPIVVARKPLEEKTVAANVLKYGTGGLNIDGSRIGTETITTTNGKGFAGSFDGGTNDNGGNTHTGRWPANIILDPYTAELLDEQSGQVKGNPGAKQTTSFRFMNDAEEKQQLVQGDRKDVGGASRFFYVAKASKKDRNEGLDDLPDAVLTGRDPGQDAMQNAYKTRSKVTKNIHPTVKPTSLMEYLIKLVTPPNGIVLDPFTGSGSTGKAALLNGFKFIGIELTEEYLPIIEGRLKWASEQASQKEEEKNEVLF